jgi:hypothetical protein
VGKLLNLFVDICLLRAGPQALPASSLLLLLTALAGLLSGALVIVSSFAGMGVALGAQVLDLLLIAGLLRVVLAMKGLQARFLQTASALFGCGVVINLATMPVQLMADQQDSGSLSGDLGVVLYLFLLLWALVVVAHILRHALEIRFVAGLLLSLGYFLIVNWLVQLIFPVA